jgi:hypothetical protein
MDQASIRASIPRDRCQRSSTMTASGQSSAVVTTAIEICAVAVETISWKAGALGEPAAAAALALLRFKLGLIPTLAGSAMVGIAWYLAGGAV